MMRSAATALLAALAAAFAAGAPDLAIERGGAWHVWWRSDSAPAAWPAELPAVTSALSWRTAGPGLEWGELRLSGSGEAWRIRVVVVRLDPGQHTLQLETPPPRKGPPNRWTVDHAPAEAALALNAGQFGSDGAWGWVVRDGIEQQAPGSGPLAPAIVIDRDGTFRIVPADSISDVRASGRVAQAFQSYPALLDGNGAVPRPIRAEGSGVDLDHRDARLAIGELRDGRMLIALTRFEGFGGVLDNLPFGLTTPEMAAVMGALGARRAVLLDGGISSQLLLRTATGTHAWRGMRYVPLGLSAKAR
ncbi:MAG TPA: phosphodiester glycosidase family protein [Gemmatimonadales bacterium]|nr:phosphodiester glycosidase family protein [Gemmatimonadales bacterium]